MGKWRWVFVMLVSLSLLAGSGIAPAVASSKLAKSQLKNGPVPPLCLHPAGVLHDGALLTEAEELAGGSGNVWYIASALGKISPTVKHGASAIIRCYAGGVPWPDSIVFYAPGPVVVGVIDLGDVFADQAGEERPLATSIKVRKGVTTVEVANIAQGDQSPNFGTAAATIKIAWRSGKFVVISRLIRNHVYAAKRLLIALKSGKVARVKVQVGSRSRALAALRWYRALGKDKTFYGCWDMSAETGVPDTWRCRVGTPPSGLLAFLSVQYIGGKNRVTGWGTDG